MKFIRLTFIGITIIFSINAYSQDHYFSQFNSSPLSLNPALTGSFNGQDRIIANYRNQWPQILQNDSYQTYALSYDHREKFKSGDYLGLGASYYADVSGGTRFGTIQLALSCSYAKTISKSSSATHCIIGGLQLGIAQRKIDPNNLRWSTSPEPYGPIGVVTQPDFLFIDFNGGLMWISRFGKRKSFHAGISTSHINRPNVSFQSNTTQRLSMKTTIHLGSELSLSSSLSLLPSIMFLRQGIHSQINIGTMLGISNLSNSLMSNVQGGIYYRAGQDFTGALHSDAIIAIASLQIKGIQLGLSYDFTISELNFNTLGSMEVSLGYVFNKANEGMTPYDVPQF